MTTKTYKNNSKHSCDWVLAKYIRHIMTSSRSTVQFPDQRDKCGRGRWNFPLNPKQLQLTAAQWLYMYWAASRWGGPAQQNCKHTVNSTTVSLIVRGLTENCSSFGLWTFKHAILGFEGTVIYIFWAKQPSIHQQNDQWWKQSLANSSTVIPVGWLYKCCWKSSSYWWWNAISFYKEYWCLLSLFISGSLSRVDISETRQITPTGIIIWAFFCNCAYFLKLSPPG